MTDEREMHRAMKKERERKRPGPFTVTGVQHWLALLKSIYFLSNWTSAQFSQAILADGLVNTLPCVPEEKLQCIMKAKKKTHTSRTHQNHRNHTSLPHRKIMFVFKKANNVFIHVYLGFTFPILLLLPLQS